MILSDCDILLARDRGAIVIDPFRREALGPNSYDVHLGSHLGVYFTSRCGHLDAARENNYDLFRIDDDGFVLSPGTIYLAATEEYTETHEHIPYLDGKHGIVQVHFGESGNRAQQHIFYAGLFGGGNRYGIAVAAEPGGKPDYVHVSDCRRLIARRWNVGLLHAVPPLPGPKMTRG